MLAAALTGRTAKLVLCVLIVNYSRTSSGREGKRSPCHRRTEQKERRGVVSISFRLV
jgi:hypothetical protein